MGVNRERHYTIAEETLAGRVHAAAKHGENSIEALPADSPLWLPILVEEVGEVAHELTYDSAGSLRDELIDVITVATSWVAALDRPKPRQEYPNE